MPKIEHTTPTAAEMNSANFGCSVSHCAACGIMFMEPAAALQAGSLEVERAFPTRSPQEGSARNPRGLFKNLVAEDGSFDVCPRCERGVRAKQFKTLATWAFDHGDPGRLPLLSVVEKAAISQARVYGRIVTISPGSGANGLYLSGHIINFPQDSAFSLQRVASLPNRDLPNLVSVTFLGPSAVWQAMLPQLRGSGVLQMRPQVVRMWLGFLKRVNHHYHRVEIDFEDEEMIAAAKEIEESVTIDDSGLTRAVERAAKSDIAEGLVPEGREPNNNISDDGEYKVSDEPPVFADVYLQRQDLMGSTLKEDGEAVLETLKIRSSETPMNEFEQAEAIFCQAFPWVFLLGKIGGIGAKLGERTREQITIFYDKRVSGEVNVIFMMFNQLCRHKVATNVAHARAEDMGLIEDACRNPEYIEKVFSEGADEDMQKVRRKLVSALGVAQKSVPFSKGEMSKAYMGLISTVRWRLAPMVFLTVSPSSIDNSLSLRLAGCDPSLEYTARSNAVYESPGASALFFKFVIGKLTTLLLRVRDRKVSVPASSLDAGVFGRIVSMATTTEVQGRTLLHAHILIWTDFGPDVSQFAVFKNMSEWIREYVDFVDSVSTTKMPKEFWEMSNELWEKRELPDPPGAKEIPDTEEAQMKRLWIICHKYGCHRSHKGSCFKHGGKCRFGMPASWCALASWFYDLTLEKGDPKKGTTDSVAYGPNPRAKCTHVLPSCGCTVEDMNRISDGPLCALVQNRPKGQDQLVTTFTPSIAQFTASNSCTVVLSTMEQANACIMYIIKYNTKRKETAANCMAAAIAGGKRAASKENRTSRTLHNAFANAFMAQTEIAATMAAYANIGGTGFESTETFWYIFPWPILGEEACGTPEREKGEAPETNDGAPDYDVLGGEGFDDPGGGRSRIFLLDGGKVRFNASQHQIYNARPKDFDNVSFILFSLMVEVEPSDEGPGGGRERNDRFEFKEGFELCGQYRLKMRSLWPCPVFAGAPPPAHPARPKDRHADASLWARYWAAVVIPWRGEPKPYTYSAFSSWLEGALSGDCLHSRILAKIVVNTSFETRRNSNHARVLSESRMLHAARAADVCVNPEDSKPKFTMEDVQMISHATEMMFRRAQQSGESCVVNLRLIIGSLEDELASGPLLAMRGHMADEGVIESVSSYAFEPVARKLSKPPLAANAPPATAKDWLKLPKISQALNKRQNDIRSFVIESLDSAQGLMFVQGEAGTGKTHSVRSIYEEIAPLRGPNFMKFMTPTGVAAENLMMGATTVHRCLGFNPFQETIGNSKLGPISETFKGVDVVVVDEISMVSPALLLAISTAMNSIAMSIGRIGVTKDSLFGNFTVLLMGDFRQIPPVGASSLLYDALLPKVALSCPFRKFRTLVLEEQVRAEDPVQREHVSSLKGGFASLDLIQGIKPLSRADVKEGFLNGAFFVTFLNSERHELNNTLAESYARLSGHPVIKWRHPLKGSSGSTFSAEDQEMLYSCTGSLWSTFVPGAPGIISSNINPAFGLANGSNCTFVSLSPLCGADMEAVAAASPGEVVFVTMPEHVFVHIPFLDTLAEGCGLFQICDGRRCFPISQAQEEVDIKKLKLRIRCHPVGLCFAMTAHKCQGKTLKKVVICLSRNKGAPKITFEQFLVATTRVRAFADMRRLEMDEATVEHLRSGLAASPAFEIFFDARFDSNSQRHYDDNDPRLRELGKKSKRPSTVCSPAAAEPPTIKGPRAEPTDPRNPQPKTPRGRHAVCNDRSDPRLAGNPIDYHAILVAASNEGLDLSSGFINDMAIWERMGNGELVDEPFHTVLVTRFPYVHFVYAHYGGGVLKATDSLVESVGLENLLGELAPALSAAFGRPVSFEIKRGEIQGANECAYFSLNNLLVACGSQSRYDRRSIMDAYAAFGVAD